MVDIIFIGLILAWYLKTDSVKYFYGWTGYPSCDYPYMKFR